MMTLLKVNHICEVKDVKTRHLPPLNHRERSLFLIKTYMTPWTTTRSTKPFCNNYVTLEIHIQKGYTSNSNYDIIRIPFRVNI
jgi:hypothetical protein